MKINEATHIIYPPLRDPSSLPSPLPGTPDAQAVQLSWLEACVAQNLVLNVSGYLISIPSSSHLSVKRPLSDPIDDDSVGPEKRPRLVLHDGDEEETPEKEALFFLEQSAAQSSAPEGGWLPRRAAWFSLDSVHPLETQALPEFFSGNQRSKTPELYRKYRHFMVLTYRLNPYEYLTVSACRRVLAGDVCALMRIHAFLDYWGLINAFVPPAARPHKWQPQFTGHFRILLDTPQGLRYLPPPEEQGHHEGQLLVPVRKGIYQTRSTSMQAWSVQDAQTVLHPIHPPPRPTICDTCGSECSDAKFVLLTYPDAGPTLCRACYETARFPAPFRVSDFVQVQLVAKSKNPQEKGGEDDWTSDENLALLQAVHEHGVSSWPRVAQAVGTRSPQECALQFLQMPIEDRFLPPDPMEKVIKEWNLLASLAQAVRPEVSRNAARKAIAALNRAVKTASQPFSSTETGDDVPTRSQDGTPAEENSATGSQTATSQSQSQYQHRKDTWPLQVGANANETGVNEAVHLRLTPTEQGNQEAFFALARVQMERCARQLTQMDALEAQVIRERHQVILAQRQTYSQRLLVRHQLRQAKALVEQQIRAHPASAAPPAQEPPSKTNTFPAPNNLLR